MSSLQMIGYYRHNLIIMLCSIWSDDHCTSIPHWFQVEFAWHSNM